MEDCGGDSFRQVAAVGVAALLASLPENAQGILPFQYLLHEVRDDVAHCQRDVPAGNRPAANRPPLAYANAVERPADGVGKFVLLPGTVGEIFTRQFLKSIGAGWRRTLPLMAFG